MWLQKPAQASHRILVSLVVLVGSALPFALGGGAPCSLGNIAVG